MKALVFLTLTLLIGACVIGCGGGSAEVRTPGRAFHETPAQPLGASESAELTADGSNLMIAEDIRKACGIDNPASYFAYDSAQLSGREHPVLDRLVDCFATGPLKGRNLLFVGHCDPRGEHEYNLVLGERRAAMVKQFFTDRGLDDTRIATSSRGYMDATGIDEASWALDRRVDIRLHN